MARRIRTYVLIVKRSPQDERAIGSAYDRCGQVQCGVKGAAVEREGERGPRQVDRR